MAQQPDATSNSAAELGRAFDGLLESIRSAERDIVAGPAFSGDIEMAAGYQHIVRSMKKAIEGAVLQDVDFPYFRILDFWQREGGDNPDQRYAFSPVRGGEDYRIWGSLGSACRIEVQLYSGDPWAGPGAGESVGYLTFEELLLTEDGDFEVLLTSYSDPDGLNELVNPAEATSVFVRHIYDEWNPRYPGEVHIDRVGFEGNRQLPPTATEMVERLDAASHMVERAITVWPDFVNQRYVEARDPNSVSPLFDTYAMGGARGRWMASGHFKLDPGEVLVFTMPPTDAQYQALQVADLWFASLEYGNLTSSLTTTQMVLSPDGNYYVVVSPEDPGHANWLDTGGRTAGVFLLRYDGVEGDVPAEQHPTTSVVSVDELESFIPGFEAVDAQHRAAARATRRQHLQIRTNR